MVEAPTHFALCAIEENVAVVEKRSQIDRLNCPENVKMSEISGVLVTKSLEPPRRNSLSSCFNRKTKRGLLYSLGEKRSTESVKRPPAHKYRD